MSNKHIAISLKIKEMHAKLTMKHKVTPIILAKIRSLIITNDGKNVRQQELIQL